MLSLTMQIKTSLFFDFHIKYFKQELNLIRIVSESINYMKNDLKIRWCERLQPIIFKNEFFKKSKNKIIY